VGSIELDAVISRFMKAHDIRAMSVAVAHDGTLTGNRGYTWAAPNYPITQPHTLFRVASVSKIFTCAAIDRLVKTGALNFATQAFGYLGITSSLLPTQTPDPEVDQITVLQLAKRRSGLQRDFGVDFRTIASRLGQSVMPTRAQLVAYLYGEPLFARPGTVDHYSNSAFAVLTSIVEKASGRSFIDYLRQDLLQPLHLDDVRVGATAANGRIPNEVSTYDDAGFGPSQIDMAADATAPNAYGGQFTLENGEGEGGLIMSTGTVARFLATHAVWEIGSRESGTRYGEFAGTGAAAVSRPDGIDFAYAFNRLVDTPHHDALVGQINAILDRHTSVKADGGLGSIGVLVGTLAGTIHRWIALRLER
jgi:CubicO group peptidase (beta-lactamase class C family)